MMGRYIISGIRAARDDTSHKPEKRANVARCGSSGPSACPVGAIGSAARICLSSSLGSPFFSLPCHRRYRRISSNRFFLASKSRSLECFQVFIT